MDIRSKLQIATNTIIAYAWYLYIKTKTLIPVKKRNGSTRHILILAHLFPPKISGGIYRIVSNIKYLINNGWKVTVICGPMPDSSVTEAGLHMLRQIPKEVNVLRIYRKKKEVSYSFFPRVDGGFINVINCFRIALKELRDMKPSVIFASGPPFYTFISAYYLAKYFGCRNVIEYRDEWSENPFGFVEISNKDRIWEKKCLNYCDEVIFTTESQRIHQGEKFSIKDNRKFHVLPNGWEPDDFFLCKEERGKNNKDIKISFIGNLGNHTLPEPYLSMFEKILDRNTQLKDRLILQFVGNKSNKAIYQIEQFKYKKNIVLIDNLPKPEANKLMKDSDGLIIFSDERFERYIAGKFYDYIASKTPVIVFGKKGEMIDVVNQIDAGYIIDNDIDALELALMSLNKKKIGKEKIAVWLKEHERKNIAKNIMDLIE